MRLRASVSHIVTRVEKMDRESGIAKNILLALVAAIAIIVVVIVAVMIVFPPQPDVIPKFQANIERSGNTVYIYHDGGDPLQSSRTLVRVNGVTVPPSSISFLHAQDWPWTVGKTLRIQYEGPGSPDLVEIVYSGSKGEVILFSSQAPTASQTLIPVTTVQMVTPTVTVTPSVTGPAVSASPTPAPVRPSIPQPPQAGFTADPRTGQAPLIVRFTDTSTGVPTSWLWNFGDGETSTEQNPVHTYKTPGTYSVALTVNNQFGSGQKVEKDYVAVGTVPVAQFAAIPSEGESPLSVQFNDLSGGNPSAFSWDFGDGSWSTERNPTHTYTRPGTYTVTLAVSNPFGSDTRIQSGVVKVSAPKVVDVSLTGSRNGLLSTGYLQFLVTGEGGWVKIAGSTYPFSPDDQVQVFIDNAGSGMVDVNANGISGLRFDSVRMFVNGKHVRSGIVTDMRVPSFAGLSSTLTITILPEDQTMVLFINSSRIIPGSGQKVVLGNLCQNSGGLMNLQFKPGGLEYRGGARSFRLE